MMKEKTMMKAWQRKKAKRKMRKGLLRQIMVAAVCSRRVCL